VRGRPLPLVAAPFENEVREGEAPAEPHRCIGHGLQE
jgi:hypothetical protein